MNHVLELRGKKIGQMSKKINGGGTSMNRRVVVTLEHLDYLTHRCIEVQKFWKSEKKVMDGILVSVFYNKIVANSNRISGLFKGVYSNGAIVGAKFNEEKTKHIITYYLDDKDLSSTIELLEKTSRVVSSYFQDGIHKDVFENRTIMDKIPYDLFSIKKSVFKSVIADVSYIEDFNVEMPTCELNQSIISLYNTHTNTQLLLKKLGIDIMQSRILDNQTVFLNGDELQILMEKAPYLVSMATENILNLSPEDFMEDYEKKDSLIPLPKNEPTIGVIDTLFDERVYFGEWVEYHDMVDKNIPRTSRDYDHGTSVSSLIVDGPQLNPWLDDGCGRFRVRHFGVATSSNFSSFTIIKQIREIIAKNRDIKVWNLSLGSNQEIHDNFISAEGAVLDKIQYENDVIFVVAGTNKSRDDIVKIGSPADSINSMVVNAVTKSNVSTKYSRRGLALSFFAKPDVSYYGGSKEQYIRVCKPLGEDYVAGTSYAAPWIARKLSYLIDVLGLNREVAKALLIDVSRGWSQEVSPERVAYYGHGIVPIRIEDVIQTKDDEIRFMISDVSEKWNTYNYDFPVPIQNGKYPYIARATMCYFPKCDRMQGVDYTNTELNLHFGRINDKGKIEDIKGDKQNQEETIDDVPFYLLEKEARKRFRKWDNVKYVSETLKSKMKPKKMYKGENWGIEIKTNNRLNPEDGIGLRFGVVVTLKEINGVNRIDEFIRNCTLKGWLVNEIDVQNRIEIHQQMNEEIQFD